MTPQAGGVATQEIELNTVCAGLCANPKYDRYCGYAIALAKGSSLARQGIRIGLGEV